jgi:hypothetical protein
MPKQGETVILAMLLVLVCSTTLTIGCVLTIVGALGLWRAHETDNTEPVRCTSILALYGGVPEPSAKTAGQGD